MSLTKDQFGAGGDYPMCPRHGGPMSEERAGVWLCPAGDRWSRAPAGSAETYWEIPPE